MELEDVIASGFDENIKARVRSWGILRLTHVQILSLEAGIANGVSQVVCAPTSSGKTLVAEIAILSALRNGKRCVYLVSHKALADQKYIDFDERFGSSAPEVLSTVGLSTGDREEGEVTPQLLVATYEKALALLLTGQLDVSTCLVIADELQIIGEDGRGPNIEALCSIFRQQKLDQFLALTATVGNPEELAYWLGCKLVLSNIRDVELYQEIWNQGGAYVVKFGEDVGELIESGQSFETETLRVVDQLVSLERGPVLVFTESRREAIEYASSYSEGQSRTAEGIEIAEQLDFFSEPTEASEQLQVNAQKRVAFHTADLTAQERQVIEEGFADSKFLVCFATSTLSAGVNYPFRSVVFPKLTYEWGERAGTHIKRSDYRNMSGRAGRLGMHERGYAILLPSNPKELGYANDLVLPENDNINSQLVNISMRRSILTFVSSRVVDKEENVRKFFENTYLWYQISEHNPGQLDDVIAKADESVEWLVERRLVERTDGALIPTPLGKAVAESGLMPSTAISFLEMMTSDAANLEANFDGYIPGILHWICSCDEFRSNKPTRFLVYPVGRNPVSSTNYLSSNTLLTPLDRTDNQVNQCAHALSLYCQGVPERHIRFQTNIPSGGVHRLALDVGWILDGLQRISSVHELGYPQTLTNKMAMLARRVRWGAPAEALDIIRIAQRNNVPGFGRQRAMALIGQGLSTFGEILGAAKNRLVGILRSEDRTMALLQAIAISSGFQTDRYQKVHAKVALELGLADVLSDCDSKIGTEYEDAIKRILEAEVRWAVRAIDDGKQQNVPDLLVTLGKKSVLIECKTTTKSPPLIKKEEAFAVLQKAVDYDKDMHRVTLGKPSFDEHSKKKVQGANDISLIEHSVFIEGILRVHAGVISPDEFLNWISVPGLIEVGRLGGIQTYNIATY